MDSKALGQNFNVLVERGHRTHTDDIRGFVSTSFDDLIKSKTYWRVGSSSKTMLISLQSNK